MKFFEEALEIDSNFADAYSYLSYGHLYGWIMKWSGFDDTLDQANELAERAVALDSSSANALARLGFIQSFMRRYDPAIANMEKAIALAPDRAEIYASFGHVLNFWGDPEKALKMSEKAFSLESFAPPAWEYYAGLSHLLFCQYDQAVTKLNRMIERAPKFAPAYLWLACSYVESDRIEDAHDAVKTALEIVPQYTVKEFTRIFHFRVDECRNRILDSLRKAGLPEG